jgi:hypothetical protein
LVLLTFDCPALCKPFVLCSALLLLARWAGIQRRPIRAAAAILCGQAYLVAYPGDARSPSASDGSVTPSFRQHAGYEAPSFSSDSRRYCVCRAALPGSPVNLSTFSILVLLLLCSAARRISCSCIVRVKKYRFSATSISPTGSRCPCLKFTSGTSTVGHAVRTSASATFLESFVGIGKEKRNERQEEVGGRTRLEPFLAKPQRRFHSLRIASCSGAEDS